MYLNKIRLSKEKVSPQHLPHEECTFFPFDYIERKAYQCI